MSDFYEHARSESAQQRITGTTEHASQDAFPCLPRRLVDTGVTVRWITGMPVVLMGKWLRRFELRPPNAAVEKLVELLAEPEVASGKGGWSDLVFQESCPLKS